jgi:hypothetical protein
VARTSAGNVGSGIICDPATVGAVASACTVAFWVASTTTTGGWYAYGEASSSASQPLFGLGLASGTIRVFLRNDANSTLLNVTLTASVLDGNPHHVCYTQDASGNYVFYADGGVDHSGSHSTTGTLTVDRATIFALGRGSGTTIVSGTPFAGTMWEVATWTRQLAAAEVASLANGLPASHLGPSHYWPLWGVDSPEPDIGIGSHVAGTLNGTGFTSGPSARVGLGLVEVGG